MSGRPTGGRADPFQALADPTRRAILELLRKRPLCPAGEIAGSFPRISRPAVSRHLRVLRVAGLVAAEGRGRQHCYRLQLGALARVERDWFAPFWDASLAALKRRVESSVRKRA